MKGSVMIEIKLILARVRSFLSHRPLQRVIKGVDRIGKVLRYFEEDVENLREGLREIHDEDEQLGVQIQELEEHHGELEGSRVQAEKLLKGLKALLGE